MIRIARRHGRWLIAAAAVALVALLRAFGALDGLENVAADTRARVLAREVESDIVIVGIDAQSLEALRGWPWPRSVHGKLLDNLYCCTQSAASRPRSLFFDIDFSSPQGALDDAAFASSIRKADGAVQLPTFFSFVSGDRREIKTTRPIAQFAQWARQVSVIRETERDSLTRSWRSSWDIGGEQIPSVIDPERTLAPDHDVLIDYSISPASFEYISYVDLLDGTVDPAAVAGKQVFIGNVSVELGDMIAVPVYETLPGVVVQALATETVKQGVPRPVPAWAAFAWLVLWSVAAALLFRARWGRNLATFALLLLGIGGMSLLAFATQRLWLDTAAPAVVVALSFAAVTLRSLDRQTARALTYALGLRRRDALLKSVVQSSADCIVCISEQGIIRTANPAAAALFGCTTDDLIGEPLGQLVSLLEGEVTGEILSDLHGKVRECNARTPAGDEFPVEVCISRVRLATERLFTAFVRDIRERRAQQQRLQHQATHDTLTGLPNRAALTAYLAPALRGGPDAGRVVLLMLDLCRFKEVNDTLGHNVGDAVLCEVARRFAGVLGHRGLIARIGGDEFTVVLEQQDGLDVAQEFSQALAECLCRPIDVAGIAIEVGVSIGSARFPEDGDDPLALLRMADVAMYAAKRRGTVHERYDAAADANSLRRLAIGGELRPAIAARALELHYQPQVNLHSGQVESCEALVRWFHPVHGAISPAEFIAIAETTDLIRPLTEWTLSAALAQARAWHEQGLQMRVAVNLSARLLQDTAFPQHLAAVLAASGVPPSSLELEITESAMMLDPERALRVVQDVHQLGVYISIDDFGTGYSSLGYLRDLPVHALKLDKSFVQGMRTSEGDRIIVESTAKMAHALKLELVAEGVETEWDASTLTKAGYDYAQGFLYSRALPADRCTAWIMAFNTTAAWRGTARAV